MKFLAILLSFFLLCLCACKSQTEPNDPISSTGITGNWSWFKTVAFGYLHTPQGTNQQFTLVLKNDQSFSRSGNYTGIAAILPDSTGSFQFQPAGLCGSSSTVPGIKFSSLNQPNGGFFPQYMILSRDTMVLDLGSPCDHPLYYFVRN